MLRTHLTRIAATIAAALCITALTPLTAQADDGDEVDVQLPTTYEFNWAGLGGYIDQTAVVGNNAQVPIEGSLRVRWTPGWRVAPHLRLEQSLDGADWADTGVTVAYTEAVSTFKAIPPAHAAQGKTLKVYYRVVSDAFADNQDQGVETGDTSATVQVTYENQKLYTGYAKTFYADIKRYCPLTAVHVVKQVAMQEKVGLSYKPSLLITVNKEVRNYSPDDRYTVALHECTHQRQFINYGMDAAGWTQLEQDVAKVFVNDKTPKGKAKARSGSGAKLPFSPVEHAADCAAHAIDRWGYLAYGGYCNKAELAAGKTLLQGKRLFPAPVVTPADSPVIATL